MNDRTFHLIDERALRILAHPLRARLLGLLRAKGPATATGLAQAIGESSGVTSYHLRKLAEGGLVEEDTARGTRKERWWQALHEVTHWSPADFLDSSEGHRAMVAWQRESCRFQWRLLEQWFAEQAAWDKAWVDAAGSSDNVLEMTPESLKAMTQEIWEVVQRYRHQPKPEGGQTEWVVWFAHAVPVHDLETLT